MQRELLARTLRGIEDVAAGEIRALGGTDIALAHREVRFCAAPRTALRLRTVDDVFAVLVDAPPIGPHRTDLRTLAALAAELDVDGTSTVTASFLGRRTYSRFEIEETVTRALPGGGGPPVALRVHLTQERTTIAVRLAAAPLHRRDYRIASRPGALHPPLAAALVRLAEAPRGTVLVDPFCGTGTIAIEAKLARPDVHVVARDADPAAVRAAAANAAAAGVALELGVARAEELRRGGLVVTNPPWGRAHRLASGWSPAARAVLLLEAGLEPPRGLDVRERRWVRVAGRAAHVWVLDRRG
jgi:23S rRNA G2445 N2-methylase RlmL